MARKSRPAAPVSGGPPGKQRTREHVIAALSVNFVERLVLKCGWVVQRCNPDYGYDLRLETFDQQGYLDAEQVPLQLKATDTIDDYKLVTEEVFSLPISTKDYRLWTKEQMPVFLILYDAVLEEAYWLHLQDYHQVQKPSVAEESIRVRIPRNQVLGFETIRMMRERKQERLRIIKEMLERENT